MAEKQWGGGMGQAHLVVRRFPGMGGASEMAQIIRATTYIMGSKFSQINFKIQGAQVLEPPKGTKDGDEGPALAPLLWIPERQVL